MPDGSGGRRSETVRRLAGQAGQFETAAAPQQRGGEGVDGPAGGRRRLPLPRRHQNGRLHQRFGT